jgi:acyl phosphate:glycerol-3-phosphate acyltransferase
MREAALVVFGYVVGSTPWGLWLPRLVAGVDVRTLGSGNIGATNVWRALGFKLGLAVALLDIAKGAAVALVARWLADDGVAVVAGLAALAGHWRPLFLGFARGGKVVATTGGVGLALAFLPTLAAAGAWIAIFLVTRYASVASIVSAATLPLFALVFDTSTPVLAFTIAAAIVVAVLHRANIRRLRSGTENRFQLRRRTRPRVRDISPTRRAPPAAS